MPRLLKLRIFPTMLLTLAALFLSGCATYQGKVSSARSMLKKGSANDAAELLRPLSEVDGKDQLVYLFDYGTALQQAGRYEESNKAFALADEMSEYKDYTSLSKETTSLLFSQEMVQYKGENYEKVLISAMMAINYLMLGDYENAMVLARRLSEKLEYFKSEGEKNYEQNTFGLYLAAMLRENEKDYDNAYIQYKQAYNVNPALPLIKQDLVRVSALARRWGEHKKWVKEFNIKNNPLWRNNTYGEVIVVQQQGWVPRKRPHPDSPRFPKLYVVPSWTSYAKVSLQKADSPQAKPILVNSETIYSVEDIALFVLNDQMGKLIAKRIAGMVAKEVVAHQVRQKNEGLGDLMALAMHISDRADLRQWSTLPQTYQIARVYLKAGDYIISAEGMSDDGEASGESLAPQNISVKPGQKTFLTWRTFK